MPGPRTGDSWTAADHPVSPLRGFPPVRPAGVPVPRSAAEAADDVPAPATTALPAPAAAAGPATTALAPAALAAPRARRRGLRDRRPQLLLAALVAGAIGAGVVGVPGGSGAEAGSTAVLGAQMELATGEESLEVMPMASITEAEAQARLQEVAASRAERAAAEAAAAEAAREAARPKAVLPVDGARFTSGYGSRWGTFHYGIDLAAPIGTPEYAAVDGVVVRAGAASGFGLAVYVLHENGDVTVYGHMEEILVEPGQYVEAGETIALLGNRGQSTGPHLHFEVHQGGMDGRRIDPVPWLAERGVEV
ncbi:M23 family metallopeptidase [Geodermatophilus arenarius]|uniref:M23 family metallopeptidase n=1 Tax=Geodermatophilus arenarius TaxID=1137990 RepID=A0ABV9LEC2_9ACTN